MKKTLIGALVGGIIIFIWQFLSWSLINFHESAQQYTPKQDAIMNVLKSEGLEEGGYILPMLPKTATTEEWQQFMTNAEGKPWASIQYHNAMKNDMMMNIIRGLVVNIITVWLLCWVLVRLKHTNFANILTASLFTGLIVFLNVPYTNYIWYESFDLYAHLADAVISWGACGLWLAWWLSRNNAHAPVLTDSKNRETTVS
jgi:hypothetical protein